VLGVAFSVRRATRKKTGVMEIIATPDADKQAEEGDSGMRLDFHMEPSRLQTWSPSMWRKPDRARSALVRRYPNQ